ncbi:DUF3175 domain-containing protein [Mucilaginibacter sp.]
MSMLNFYENRAGKNLTKSQKLRSRLKINCVNFTAKPGRSKVLCLIHRQKLCGLSIFYLIQKNR